MILNKAMDRKKEEDCKCEVINNYCCGEKGFDPYEPRTRSSAGGRGLPVFYYFI